MIWSDSVYKLAKAISVAEGFGIADAIPTLANNPGDLTGADAGSFQTNGVANKEGVVKFVRLEDGWAALYVKISRILSGRSNTYPLTMTLEQMGIKYSGSTDGNWAKNVAEYLGVPVTTKLQQLSE